MLRGFVKREVLGAREVSDARIPSFTSMCITNWSRYLGYPELSGAARSPCRESMAHMIPLSSDSGLGVQATVDTFEFSHF